jgi:hypothetical protein
MVLVNGREEKHPEGAYSIEWREGSKRIRLSVGKDANEANAIRLKKEAELNARNHGVEVAAQNGKNRIQVSDAITEYLSEIEITRSSAT